MPPYKIMHTLVGGCTTGYIGILWNVLGILFSGEMVSLEKHLVFLDCYVLALRRTSSCKNIAIMHSMIIFNTVQCERGAGNHQVEGVPNGRVVLDVSIARSSVSCHIKILECICGMLAQ